jgi:DNA-binding NarL/FixJ family response regulator
MSASKMAGGAARRYGPTRQSQSFVGSCDIGMRCLTSKGHDGGPSSGCPMVRILIADDHEVVRSGLRRLIEAHADWEVVAEAKHGNEAIRQAFAMNPDVVVLDYAMPLINGIEATRQIRARLPNTEVLIYTVHDDEMLICDLLRAGARGYVLKSDAGSQVLAAIDSLAQRKPFFTSKVCDILLDTSLTRSKPKACRLSELQRDLVRLIAKGHTNMQIAELLNISLRGVELERAQIMRKLELTSTSGIVLYALETGLIES